MAQEAEVKQQQGITEQDEKSYHQQRQLSGGFSSCWCTCHEPGTVGP